MIRYNNELNYIPRKTKKLSDATQAEPLIQPPSQQTQVKQVPNKQLISDLLAKQAQTVPVAQPVNIENIISKARRINQMKRAVKFGIVGLGQGGGRLASEFEKLGYTTLAINTSEQDINELPCANKVLIGSGGAGRDLKNGATAVNTNRAKIMTELQKSCQGIQHAIICAGSSGGTGGGGLLNLIDSILDFKIPVGVITTLPLKSEDTRSKKNTLAVLEQLAKASQEGKISPFIIIDNDKIEKKYPGLSTLEFWNKANDEVVKTFDLFNMMACRTSPFTSFDPADYRKTLASGGCMIFGNITIQSEINAETIGQSVIGSLDSGLLAEGFNLVEATTAACVIISSIDKLSKFPRLAEENLFSSVMRVIGSGTVFRGVYALEAVSDFEVFFMVSGLGLPVSRIRGLISECKIDQQHLEKKATQRTVTDILSEIEESENLTK